jgi:hypothetical protein
MTILQSGISQAAAASGYQIARSLRFNSADTAYLNRTPASAGSQTTWTYSTWLKRSILSGAEIPSIFSSMYASIQNRIVFDGNDKLSFIAYNGSFVFNLVTTQTFRDFGAWYHFVFVVDSTNATSSDRIRIYVNGVRVTAFDTATYPSQNANCLWNSANVHQIGGFSGAYLNGYNADSRFIDGQALDPTSFGETDSATGVWVPKTYTGTYGTNGFWLKFDDNSGVTATTLGKDSSGNGNNWTPNNFSVTAGVGNDSLVDSPTNYGTDTGVGGEVRGNYAVLNAALNQTQYALNTPAAGAGTLSNGALQALGQASNWNGWIATIGVSSGKWYWEMTEDAEPSSFATIIGITNAAKTTTYTVTASSIAAGDTMGFALDFDAGTFGWYKNGTFQATLATGLTGEWFPVVSLANSNQITCNFGQRPFLYTAPSGHKCLCTQNLPTPAVGASASTQAGKYFNTVLYTGTGSSLSVTGVGFQPDFTWIKGRSGATNHALYDAVRGVQKDLVSNATSAETTETTGLTAFGSDGFTVGALAKLNTSTATYVGWNWKANGAGVSNTAGSISSTVSANTTAGISVVTYTGTGSLGTIGHGLGVAPAMMIIKGRSRAADWDVYHKSLGNGQYINLNLTGAAGSSAWLNNTSPSSTVFTVNGGTYGANFNGATTVAYCFAEVAGFSKFGSYTGNGSADGVFVYLGFRPRFIMGRDASGVDNWWIYDSARNTYNVANSFLRPNLSDAEGSNSTDVIDFLSNGFKIRGASNFLNENGNTFIYAAFAEAPFNYARAR